MKSLIYMLNDKAGAEELAEHLKLQLDINRLHAVNIVPVSRKNELIVQIPDADGQLEEAVEAFMADYKTGVALE